MLLVEQNVARPSTSPTAPTCFAPARSGLQGPAAELRADPERIAQAYLGARRMSSELYFAPAAHQRRQPRQPLRAGRRRPLDGLRHPAHDQLRPRRHDDGGRLRHRAPRRRRAAVRLGGALAASWPAALAGVVVERIAYRPVRGSPDVTLLLTSLAVTYILENLGILLFTSSPRNFPVAGWLDGAYQLADGASPSPRSTCSRSP